MATPFPDDGESSGGVEEEFSSTKAADPVAPVKVLQREKIPGLLGESFNFLNSRDVGSSLLGNLCSLVKNISTFLSTHEEYSLDVASRGPEIYDLVVRLSDWAFSELRCRFVRIVAPREVGPPTEASRAQFCTSSLFLQDFLVLLRCCLNMLHLLEFDFNLCMEKSQILLKMLKVSCSPGATILSSQQRAGNDSSAMDAEKCLLREVSSRSLFLSSFLEVFSDELLIHQNLRKHLSMMYYISNSSDKLSTQDCITCNIGIILELISAHFLVSCREETIFEGLSQMMGCNMMDMESPKLSLTAAMSLLGTSAIFSAPYMLQSHIILLISKCLATCNDLHMIAMNCYLSAFEQSVILYARLASHFPLQHDNTDTKCQYRYLIDGHTRVESDLGLSFNFYVRKATYEAVNVHSKRLADHLLKECSVFLPTDKSETVMTCMAYVKENRHAIQEQWREESCLILHFIIRRIAGETGKRDSQLNTEINWQEIYYGAALLNLMGSSLLQIVKGFCHARMSKKNDLCRDCGFVSGIISMFRGHFIDQYVVSDIEAAYSTKQPQSKLMLAHITSLLFYAIHRKICPLWRGCILVMIALVNLHVIEEGNLDALRAMYGCVRKFTSSQLHAYQTSMGTSLRRSSMRIASDFQKIHFLLSRKTIACLSHEARNESGSSPTEGRGGLSGTTTQRSCHPSSTSDEDHDLSVNNGSCNGEHFLKCILEERNIPDWDDLADFIEATPEKDYAAWLKRRETYNKWKNNKLAVSRHQRKKMMRRMLSKCDLMRLGFSSRSPD